MANTKITTAVIKDDAITTAKIADDAVTGALIADDVALAGNPTTTTQSAGNNTTRIATTAFVTTAINNLVDSAPSALDTLNELAAAMGDDANFSTTVTNSIATKAPLASPSLTGTVTITGNFPQLFFVDTAGSDLDAYIVNNANGLFIGKTNTPSSSNDILSLDLTNQRVGIRASSPDSLLELETAATNASGGLLLTNTNASGYSTVQFKNTGGTAQTYTLALGGSSSAFAQKLYIYDDTDSSARVVLDHSGNVGINLDTPLDKLHIADDAGGAAGADMPVVISSNRYQGDYGVGIAFRPETAASAYADKVAILATGGGYGYNMGDLHFALNNSTTISDEVSLSDSRMIIKKDGTTSIGRSITTTYTNSQGYPLHIQASGGSQTYLAISVPGDNSGDTGVVIGHDASGTRIVNRENQPILFHTGSSSGLTFTMEAGGDLSIADGNLVVASGHGIDFSATGNSSGSMSSELLDDYEEGSWTPVLTAASSAPTVSLTHVSGYYVKIGNLVYVRFGMYLGSISGGSGAVRISGLPYAGKTYGSYRQPAALANAQNLTSDPDGPVIFFLLDGDTKLEGRLFNNADTAVPISHFQANSWCIANLSYDVS